MTVEEYRLRLDSLSKEYEINRRKIMREFAISNNELKVGDIFIDHIGPIQIESIRVGFGNLSSLPECVYQGTELKKDYTPKKSGSKREGWSQNQVSFIKK